MSRKGSCPHARGALPDGSRGKDGIEIQRFESQSTKHLMQVGGKQRVEDLAEAGIVEGFAP